MKVSGWVAVRLGLAEHPIEYNCVTITDPVNVTGTEKDSWRRRGLSAEETETQSTSLHRGEAIHW